MANLRVDKITSTETFETTGSVQFVDADSLQIAANSDFDFGTGDFTVEWWQYIKEGPDEYQTVLSINYATNPNLTIQSASNAGVVAIKVYVNGSSVTFTEESNAPLSTWVHYALVRNGSGLSNLKIYRNGVQTGQGAYSGDIGSSSITTFIGGHPNVATGVDLQGFISNFRIVKGTALYTSNFKPSMRELEVVPGTVLLACQSKTDASLEKTGKTITVNGTAVASELTPGILTPIVKSGGGSAITGSVEFDGTGDYLSIPDSTDFTFGTGDFTIEFWRYRSRIGSTESYVTKYNNTNATQSFWFGTLSSGREDFAWYSGSSGYSIVSANNTAQVGEWGHLAAVRYNGDITLYLNGVAIGSDTSSDAAASFNDDSNPLIIGGDNYGGSTYDYQGFISNLRIVRGTALYTADFIPPTRELKKIPGATLLCCQDENSVTTEATGKTITSNGDPAPSNFTPQVGDDRKVTFEGVTKINSNAYFYLPTGNTESRESRSGRGGRGLFGGGNTAPANINTIQYITVATTGNARDFGDLTDARRGIAACSSSTRGLWGGGIGSPAAVNTIDYVTISSTGNAFDFGDMTVARRQNAGCSSSIRGLFAGNFPTASDIIDFITIATLANAADFGDLTVAKKAPSACSSSIRGIFGGGQAPANSNIIDFVTIATTGNAQDFGDLSEVKTELTACSSSVRGVFGGGYVAPNSLNTIEYITIASTGNATNFGDLTEKRGYIGSCSNSIRGVFGGGYLAPGGDRDIIDYVTIASTGDATDFGNLTASIQGLAGCSDSHGGLG